MTTENTNPVTPTAVTVLEECDRDTWLDLAVPDRHISQRVGPGGKRLNYIEGHTVIRTLNAKFGYDGWAFVTSGATDTSHDTVDARTGEVTHVREWSVEGRMTIGSAVRGDFGTGEDPKKAATDALKRCARQFGRRLGGSLYE